MATVPDFTPVCRTEADLDAIFGPVEAHNYDRAPKPAGGFANLEGSDPLSWPACKTCGKRRDEGLVELGYECASCHNRFFQAVLPVVRPFRRELPDTPKAA